MVARLNQAAALQSAEPATQGWMLHSLWLTVFFRQARDAARAEDFENRPIDTDSL
jgi:hypothetical protein